MWRTAILSTLSFLHFFRANWDVFHCWQPMILVLHLGVVAQQEEMKQMRIRQKANATSRAERTTEFQDSDSVRHLHSKDQMSILPHRQNVDWTVFWLSRVWNHERSVGWVCHSVSLLARTTSWWCTSSWTGILKWGLSRFDVTTWAKWITRSRSSRPSRPWSKALQANWNKVSAILPDPGKRRNLQDGGIHHQLISHIIYSHLIHCNSIWFHQWFKVRFMLAWDPSSEIRCFFSAAYGWIMPCFLVLYVFVYIFVTLSKETVFWEWSNHILPRWQSAGQLFECKSNTR